jgi:hypothetical protein
MPFERHAKRLQQNDVAIKEYGLQRYLLRRLSSGVSGTLVYLQAPWANGVPRRRATQTMRPHDGGGGGRATRRENMAPVGQMLHIVLLRWLCPRR